MKTGIFENIGNIVNNFFDKRTKEEKFFSQKFNNFFVLEDYLFCAKMIDEGYDATTREQERLNDAIVQKLNKSEYQYKDVRFLKSLYQSTKIEGLLKAVPGIEVAYKSCNSSYYKNYSILNKMINSDKKLEQEDFLLEELHHDKKTVLSLTLDFIKDYKKFYRSGMDSHGDFCKHSTKIVDQTNLKLERIVYLNILMLKNKQYVPEEITQLKEELKKINTYFERKTSRTYKQGSYLRCNKPLWETFSESLIQYSNHHDNNNNKDELLRQLQSYSARKKSLNEEIKELINKEEYDIEKLPSEVKQKIESIQSITQKINTEDTNQFIETRLPVILKRYFSIDEEYRTELKNVEGFNAQELMMQSLENIEKLLKSKQQDNNYDLLSELSVENRKLKMNKVV